MQRLLSLLLAARAQVRFSWFAMPVSQRELFQRAAEAHLL